MRLPQETNEKTSKFLLNTFADTKSSGESSLVLFFLFTTERFQKSKCFYRGLF